MTPSAVLAALAGGGVGLGIVMLAAGLVPAEPIPRASLPRIRDWLRRPRHATPSRWVVQRWRVLVAVAVGMIVAAATGWPVAACLAAAAVWWLPRLLGPDHAHTAAVARTEAVAGWAEQLRDTLSAAAGLEQAITATAKTAPLAVRSAVAALADRIRARETLSVALARAADDIADPTADLVIAALTMAAQQQARQLADLLARLAAAAREDAAGQMRAAVERARIRTSARMIAAITLGMVSWLAVFNMEFLAPFGPLEGQIVLAAAGGIFAVGFAWLARMARPPAVARLLPAGADR